jgi:hypothetical protein
VEFERGVGDTRRLLCVLFFFLLYLSLEGSMTTRTELIKEIDKLLPKYLGEVIDFVGYLRQKSLNQRDNAD